MPTQWPPRPAGALGLSGAAEPTPAAEAPAAVEPEPTPRIRTWQDFVRQHDSPQQALQAVLEGFTSFEEAEQYLESLRQTGGVYYTATGHEVTPELLDSALRQARRYPGQSPLATTVVEPLARGEHTTARTERGTAVDTEYAVVEADELIASHDTSLRLNPSYPQELQPRDRTRAASEEQVTRITSALDPERLGANPMASEGAPVVGPDLVVESGNARVIALKRLYGTPEGNRRYRDWLTEHAADFGLPEEAIQEADQPVLVRIRQTDVDRVRFAQEANEPTVARLSATEQAQQDAEQLTGGLMARFAPSETGDIDTAANRNFIRAFMEYVVGPAERSEYFTAGGELNQDGLRRIRNAVFAKAYDDITAIEKLAESTDNNVRNITNAMLVVAPRLAALREGIAHGQLFELDPAPAITGAMQKLSQLRVQGTPVSDYLNQVSLLQPKLDPLALEFLAYFDEHKRSSRRIAELLVAYVEIAEAAGNPQQVGFFADTAPSKLDILEAALRRLDISGKQVAIWEAEPEGGVRAPETAPPEGVPERPEAGARAQAAPEPASSSPSAAGRRTRSSSSSRRPGSAGTGRTRSGSQSLHRKPYVRPVASGRSCLAGNGVRMVPSNRLGPANDTNSAIVSRSGSYAMRNCSNGRAP